VSGSEHFDAIVVGSGFGGSVMAYRLAEAGLRVCVLERGKRYPPGSFARSPREMRDNLWDPGRGKQGLFQVWSFGGIDGVVAAGLGGGSLIYANVLIRKDERWFFRRRPDGGHDEWPVSRADLEPHYDRVESMLAPQRLPVDHSPYDGLAKTAALREAAQALDLDWTLPDLAITFGDPTGAPVPGEPIRDPSGGTTDNLHGRTRYTCRLCGECNIGCNYGSKNTLDYNYLTEADRLGAELRDRCDVRHIAPRDEGGYVVGYVTHVAEDENEDQVGGAPAGARRSPEVDITADRLILAAGTFGTADLLLKNQHRFPGLSDRLGHYVSGNGDLLGVVHDARRTEGGRAVPRVLAPSRGPVITSTIRVPDQADGGSGPGLYLQDGGYPGFVDWLVEATDATGVFHRVLRFVEQLLLNRVGSTPQPNMDARIAGLIGDARRSSSLLPLLGMGMDTPDGVLSLDSHGRLSLDWHVDRSSDYFAEAIKTMGDVAASLGGKFSIDPLWHLRRTLVTVHPLGGCSMGVDSERGVVGPDGSVFGYPGLVIADGSVMPGPVGPNPSLTIAALSDRFADSLIG